MTTEAVRMVRRSRTKGIFADLWILIVLLGFVFVRLLGSDLFHHTLKIARTVLVR